MPLDLNAIRAKFPALAKPTIYFDNPAGTQITQSSLDRINAYLTETNANYGGAFASSRASDEAIDEARRTVADFLHASRPEEIVFGPNMTSLTLHLSRSIAQQFDPGDTIVVTHLDHDANISPWMLIAEDRSLNLEWVDFDVEDGTLRLETLEAALEKKPKLVAVGYASNALGTINPVKHIVQQAKAAGALTFVDAVQYAPHGPIDVQDLGCDFLACSAYKFYGPHVGILYGKYDLLDELKAYKVRPAPNDPPGKFETGTPNFEGISGVRGALEHFEWIGTEFGADHEDRYAEKFSGRALRLKQGMAAVRAYEYELSRALLETFKGIPGLRIYGLDDVRRIEERVPTFAVNLEGIAPRQLAEELDKHNIFVWDGNYYALAVTLRLGVEDTGGMVRIGAGHYNTIEEVHKLGEALEEIARSR
jgi:cysteine desulfurase family protein (TIGR01976 family)